MRSARGIITLLTDFGYFDPYVATMKGVILNINPNVNIIDITHDIPKYNIRYGALILRAVVPFFPPQAIHVAVVDPGVGSERKAIIVETKDDRLLVGPDNGLLSLVAKERGLKKAVEISNERYMLKPQSTTFAGRDVFAPVAAYLSLGIEPEEFGEELETIEEVNLPKSYLMGKEIRGKIIAIDSFGNIITNIPFTQVRSIVRFGETLEVCIGGKRMVVPFVRTYGEVSRGELLALIDSFNYLEVSVNKGNAAKRLGASVGAEVIIRRGGGD